MTAPTAAKKRAPKIRPNLPAPASVEGELFAYTPDEAAQYVPLSPRELRERAYRREIEHINNGNKVWLTGLHIRAVMQALTVPAVAGQRAKSA